MKKFVRGLYGRVMGILLIALMMVPSTLSLPTIAQAAGGGRQNIILLPLHTADDDAPFDLAGRISRELQVMLSGQTGVEVNELIRNSPLLTRASKTMEDAKFAELMASYDKAIDPKLRMDVRVAAAGTLAEGLGVDAVVFGVLDQYEFTTRPDPRRAYIHLTAVKVTKEANAPAYASPFEVIGKSRVLPDNGGSQLSHDAEAIGDISRNLAAQMTGGKQINSSDPVRPPKDPKVGTQPVIPDDDVTGDVEKPKGKFNILYGILAVGLIAALAGGGGGGGGGAVAPPPAVPGLAFAAPTSTGVEFQLVKPDKFDQLASFRIQRADRGVAGTRAASARAATEVVATVPKSNLILNNNFVYFSDGPLSTNPPIVGHVYEYTLVAVYSDGSTETFDVVNLSNRNTTTVGPGVPPPVQNVTARVITGSIVEISWDLGSPLPSFVTGFVIERKLASEPPSAWKVDGAVAPASARAAQRTVPAAGEYVYRVYAKSSSGLIHPTQVSNSITVITSKPQGPASVTVTEVPRVDARGSVGLRVEWPVPTDSFVDGYELYRLKQSKSATANSITRPGTKLMEGRNDRRSPGRGGGRGSVRDPRLMGSRAESWELLKKITTRLETSYLDTDVTDRMGYTYRVVALAGAALAQPFKADPVDSTQFWVDLDPGDVTTLDVTNTRGNVNLTWQAPAKNADGLTDLLDGQAYEIWRSTTLAAGTLSVTRAVLEQKFEKIKTVAWGINTYRDVDAPLRQSVMYAIVPVDAANQYAPGDYQTKGLTPLPDIADVTIAPSELTVTLGAPAEMLTITAVGTDSLPVPNAALVTSCQTGLLSKSADGAGAANSQQLTTGDDGKAVVYWKAQIVGEDYITVNVLFDGKAAGISSQTHVIINAAIAESLTLTLADEEVVAVDAIAPHASLDPTKKEKTTAKVKLTDNKGVAVPNKKIIFACTDPNVVFFDANNQATNFAITDQNGEATVTVRAGYKVGTVTIVAFLGTMMKDATLRIGPGQPSKMRMIVQNPLLPARTTASTSGTVEVADKNDNVTPNTAVLLTTSHGTLNPIVGATDANGKLAFTLTAATLPDGVLQQNVTLTAGIFSVDPALTATPVDLNGNAVQVRFVALVPNRIELTANVATLVADPGSQAVITAKVYDVFGQLVDDGTEVEFTVAGGGVFQGTATQTAKALTVGGIATVILQGTPSNGAVTLAITAESGTIQQTMSLLMQPKVDVIKVLVTPAVTTLLITNNIAQRQTTLDILVTDKGVPAPNVAVDLVASDGTLATTTAVTGADGYVRNVGYTGPSKAQTVTITARALEVTGATQIVVRGGMPALIELSMAGPWALLRTNGRPATGADYASSVYARITDEYGNAVPDGTQVFFELVEPNSYQYEPGLDYQGNPYPAPGVPKPNTGTPYGTITPMATTSNGACTVNILSADRNTPVGGAQIIARVSRTDGRVIFATTFRVAGPNEVQARVLMVGGPVPANSNVLLNAPATITAGTLIPIRVNLGDDRGQPCAGNTPYTMSFVFTDDGSLALPTVTGRTDQVGGIDAEVTVTDLKGLYSRPFVVMFEVGQQLQEMPLEIASAPITITAASASTMTLTLDPVVDGTSATQIYAYPEQFPAYLGPDQIRVIADDIRDKYGNPVLPTSVDPLSKVVFTAGMGRFVPTLISDQAAELPLVSVDISPYVQGGRTYASATTYYRSRSHGAEKITASTGGSSAQTAIRVIGGARTLRFDSSKPALQMGADAGSNFDEADLTITALDAFGKSIADSDDVGVWLSSDQGQLLNLPSFIDLAGSKITGKFRVYANGNPGPGYLVYDWKSGIYGQDDQNIFNVAIVGPPMAINFLNPPTFINSTDTVTLTVSVKDVNGTNILKDAVTVQFAVDNPGFVLEPTDGKVKVGDNGLASVKVKAADPAKVTDYDFIVSARAGAATAATANIAYKKPAKDIKVSVQGTALLPTDANVHFWQDGLLEETTVVISATDDAGKPVPANTPLSILNITGVNATFVNPTTNLELGTSPSNLLFDANGTVTLKVRGKGGAGGNATIHAESGAAKVDNKDLNFVGPPAKLTLTTAPDSPAVVNSPVRCDVAVLDAADKPVFDGYRLTASATGTAVALINNLASPQQVVTSNGAVTFTMTGTTAGSVTVAASYGAVRASAAYDFQGTGSMVFSYAPTSARILSNGTSFLTVTVNGYLPGTTNPVPDGTGITLTTDKGHFSNNQPTISGTYRGGVFTARLYGETTPAAADLGIVQITADSTGVTALGGATFYGPVDAIALDEPATLNVVVNRPINLTARLTDVAGNPADALVAIKTTSANNNVTNSTTSALDGVATFSVTPSVVGNYTVEVSANGKSDSRVFTVNTSIPTVLDVSPVGVAEAQARVTANGTGNPLQYRITAVDAQGQPAGSFTAQVTIAPAGIISLDQYDFSGAGQQVNVPIDANGIGTFWVNGTAGAQVGASTITVTNGTLTDTTTVSLIGLAKTLLVNASGTRLLANDNDKLTFQIIVRDEKNQPVMDGTPVTLVVEPVAAGDPPVVSNEYRFSPGLPKTTNGTVTVDFYCSRIAIVKAGVDSGLWVKPSADGTAATPVKVSSEGAQSLTLALVTGQPARVSADGISGPAGANQTQVRVTGTAVNSAGTLLTGAQLAGLPVTVASQKGILNNQTPTITTRFDTAGMATLTLSGTISTTPGASNCVATSGDATSDPLAVAFVGQADAVNGFTYVSSPVAVNNKLTVYQDTQFTLEVTAKDAANPAQPVLRGTTLSILANGLTVAGNTDIATTDDTGRVRWTLTASTAGTRDIFVKADEITANTPFTVEVIPVAKDFTLLVKEEKRIFFDPNSAANLPKTTSFELTGYQSVGGPPQAYAEVTLTTDMGQFIATQGVTPQANGKIAKVVLNQAGTQLIRFSGDGASVGTPNIQATSGTVGAVTKALNTAATPIQLIGQPYRIICQAGAKYPDPNTLSDDLRVMQDNPVTIVAQVQDSAGNTVLDGFMIDFSLPAGAPGILRARNTLITGGTVKADLSSNESGVFVVTAKALDTTGAPIAGVEDTTTVTIRTYAKTITLDGVTPASKRISQDGHETAKLTVNGIDANGDPVLAGTPARFTILQADPLLATLVDPLNESSYGDVQDVIFDNTGKAEIFVRGQGVIGKVGAVGVQVASYNTSIVPGPDGAPIFNTSFTNQVSLYGPGNLTADNPDLTAVMEPIKIVPGSTGDLTVALKKNGIAYNPAWYTLQVTSDVGAVGGAQVLATSGANAGECALTYTITAEEAELKLASINKKIKVTVTVTGSEQAGAGTKTQDFLFEIADKPWPGIVDPAVKYTVTAKTPATLLDAAPNGGLNLNTEGTLTVQLLDAAGQPLGQGRDITILASDGFVGDDLLGAPTQGTATMQTGTDGKIVLRVKAPDQKPATGKMTLTFKDGATTLAQVDGTGNPMASNLIDINIKDAKLIATLSLESIGATKRIYYSTKPEDTIYTKNAQGNYVQLQLATRTTVTFRGMTGDTVPVGAAGAMVTVTTDRGVIRKTSTVDAFETSKTYALDTQGYLTLDIEGTGADADLGTPRFTVTAVENNLTKTFDANQGGTDLDIVGKADRVTVTTGSANFFQNAETNVTVAVTDKAGQPVLDGWPVEFIQSSLQWADPTAAEWWETGGDGIFRLPVSPVTTNGVCVGQFGSNFSGRYSVGANVPKSFTPGAPPVPDFITGTKDVVVKTFARNYEVKKEAAYPTRILADGTELTHLYVVCRDNDNKKLLEGVKVAIRPNVGRLIQESDANNYTDAPTTAQAFSGQFMEMAVNQDSEIRFFVRGRNRIGHVGLELNNDLAQAPFSPNPPSPVPVYSWNTVAAAVPGAPDVVLYGPELAEATADVEFGLLIDNGIKRIAGLDTGNNIPANSEAVYVVEVTDKFGNPFPAGFKATIVDNGTPVNDPPVLETDTNGQITLRHSLLLGANDILKRNITIYMIGEGAAGTINRTFAPQPPDAATNLYVTKPISATVDGAFVLGLGESRDISAGIADDDGTAVLDGFPVSLTTVGLGSANISGQSGRTLMGGVTGTLNAGGTTGSFVIRAYYNYPFAQAALLGTSQTIYVGAPSNSAVNTPAGAQVGTGTTTAVTATLTTGGQNIASGYPVTLALAPGSGGNLANASTNVGTNGQVTFNYTAPNVGAGTSTTTVINVSNRAPLPVTLPVTVLTTITLTAVGVPATPGTPGVNPGSKEVTIQWAAPTSAAPITLYRVSYRKNGGILQTQTTTSTSLKITGLAEDDVITAQVEAFNLAGWSGISGTGTGIAGP